MYPSEMLSHILRHDQGSALAVKRPMKHLGEFIGITYTNILHYLMYIGPCIIVIVEEEETNLMS